MNRYLKASGFLIAPLVIAASGCQRPEDKFVGRYSGLIKPSANIEAQMAKLPKALSNQLNEQINGLKFDLDLRKDMSYTVVATVPSKGDEVAVGRWSLAGQKLTLGESQTKTDGTTRPSTAPPQILVASADSKVLTADMEATHDVQSLGTLVFTKVD